MNGEVEEEQRLGYLGNLSAEQENDLAAVKTKLHEIEKINLVEVHGGDTFLLAFLRAEMSKSKSSKGAFNIKKSMKRIVGFLEWCEDFGFNVPTGDIEMPPKYTEYKASKPSHIYLDPKAKTAVLIEKFGYTFSNIDTKRMTPREWEECIGYTGFNNRGMLREAHRKFGREPTGVHAIIDEKGLGWGFASRLKFVKFVNGIVGERFPESVDKVYIVNAPLIFSGLFAMIKPALDKDLVAKISVTSGIPTELLRSNLDPTLLPEEYGGDNTEVKVPKTVDHKSG